MNILEQIVVGFLVLVILLIMFIGLPAFIYIFFLSQGTIIGWIVGGFLTLFWLMAIASILGK